MRMLLAARPVMYVALIASLSLTGLTAFAGGAAAAPSPLAPVLGQDFVAGEVLVKFSPGQSTAAKAATRAAAGVERARELDVPGWELVRTKRPVPEAVGLLRARAGVVKAIPNAVVRADSSTPPADQTTPRSRLCGG